MHEAANHRRGELRSPHAAKVTECRDIDCPEFRDRCINTDGERIQHPRDVVGNKFPALQSNRGELLRRQRAAARIREETVDNPGHVSYMKRRGCHTGRAGVPLGRRQVLDKFADAFADLKQNVRDRLQDVGDALDGTALPPFGVCQKVPPGAAKATSS